MLSLLEANPALLDGSRAIESIRIVAYEPAYGIIGDPAKRDPRTRQSADHSMVYIVATLLRKAIEPIALKKAIQLAEQGAFVSADLELQKWKKEVGAKEMLARQWTFLRALYRPSQLVRTLEVVDANWRLIERYHQFAWQTSDKVRAQDYRLKKEVLTRCRARDEQGATAALIDALEWGASLVRERLS